MCLLVIQVEWQVCMQGSQRKKKDDFQIRLIRGYWKLSPTAWWKIPKHHFSYFPLWPVSQKATHHQYASWVEKGLDKVGAQVPVRKKKIVDDAQSILDEYGSEWDNWLDNLLTVDETWVYYKPTLTRKSTSKWLLLGHPPSEVKRTTVTSKNTMATEFWNKDGILHIDYLTSGKSINKEYYVNLYICYQCQDYGWEAPYRTSVQLKANASLSWTLLKHYNNAKVLRYIH